MVIMWCVDDWLPQFAKQRFCKCASKKFLYKSVAQSYHNTWFHTKYATYILREFCADITYISCVQLRAVPKKCVMVSTGEYGSTSDRPCHLDVAFRGDLALWRCVVAFVSRSLSRESPPCDRIYDLCTNGSNMIKIFQGRFWYSYVQFICLQILVKVKVGEWIDHMVVS